MRTRLRQEDGAAAVEFALIVGVLALLIFGMLEFGLAFWQVQNLRSATREAARTAAVRGTNDDIKARLIAASNGSLPSGYSGFTVTPALCTHDNSGDNVTVKITNSQLPAGVKQAFAINIPFMPAFTINPDLSGTFRCE
jgi:Flp pilus assembly protein TadG